MKKKGITEEVLNNLKEKLGNIYHIAVARLYKGVDSNWHFQAQGWIVFSELRNAYVFCMLDFEKFSPVWQQELYKGFKIKVLKDWFFAFKGEKNYFGLSFANAFDGKSFHDRTMNKLVKNKDERFKDHSSNTFGSLVKTLKKFKI